MIRRPPRSTHFPNTTLFRSVLGAPRAQLTGADAEFRRHLRQPLAAVQQPLHRLRLELPREAPSGSPRRHLSLPDRKSTRLNSSHANISYAVFCLKKKKTTIS